MTPNYVDSSPTGIVVSPWCSCRGSGNMEEECEKFLRDFTENPCLRKSCGLLLPQGPSRAARALPSSSVGAASDLRGASAAWVLLTEPSVWGSWRVTPALSVGEPQFILQALSLCQVRAEGFCSAIPTASARFFWGQPCGETSAICHFSLEGSIFKDPLGIGDFLFKLSHS